MRIRFALPGSSLNGAILSQNRRGQMEFFKTSKIGDAPALAGKIDPILASLEILSVSLSDRFCT
jgi:hypothetical protein